MIKASFARTKLIMALTLTIIHTVTRAAAAPDEKTTGANNYAKQLLEIISDWSPQDAQSSNNQKILKLEEIQNKIMTTLGSLSFGYKEKDRQLKFAYHTMLTFAKTAITAIGENPAENYLPGVELTRSFDIELFLKHLFDGIKVDRGANAIGTEFLKHFSADTKSKKTQTEEIVTMFLTPQVEYLLAKANEALSSNPNEQDAKSEIEFCETLALLNSFVLFGLQASSALSIIRDTTFKIKHAVVFGEPEISSKVSELADISSKIQEFLKTSGNSRKRRSGDTTANVSVQMSSFKTKLDELKTKENFLQFDADTAASEIQDSVSEMRLHVISQSSSLKNKHLYSQISLKLCDMLKTVWDTFEREQGLSRDAQMLDTMRVKEGMIEGSSIRNNELRKNMHSIRYKTALFLLIWLYSKYLEFGKCIAVQEAIFVGQVHGTQIRKNIINESPSKAFELVGNVAILLQKYPLMITYHPKFSETTFIQPFVFQIWKYEDIRFELDQLLSGEEIALHSNILFLPDKNNYDGITILKVAVEFHLQDPTGQKKLNKYLRMFSIAMIHTGNSYYKVSSQYYVVWSPATYGIFSYDTYLKEKDDIGVGGFPWLDVGENNLRVKSPFTTWRLQLTSNVGDLKKYLGVPMDLYLVGRGYAVQNQVWDYYNFEPGDSFQTDDVMNKIAPP